MNYYVYILFSNIDQGLYVGCSTNVQQRLKRHNLGHVESTKYRRPLTLIHEEKYSSKAEAFNRERFLKSLWGGREKKKIKENFLKKQ